MLSLKTQRQLSQARAFTLVEILSVIAIVVILAALSTGAVQQMQKVWGSYNADATLSGLLANARMEAVRRNAFVTVAFAPYTSDDRTYVAMILVAAKDGADLFESAESITLTKNDLLGNITVFEDFVMEDEPEAGIPRPGLPTGAEPARLATVKEIRIPAPEFPQSPLVFNRILRFNPAGEAIGDQSFSRLIEFGIHPLHHVDQVMVAQINGLTGQSRVLKK